MTFDMVSPVSQGKRKIYRCLLKYSLKQLFIAAQKLLGKKKP